MSPRPRPASLRSARPATYDLRGASRWSEAGQATVELVALLPVLLLVTLAAAALLAGHGAREQAGHAAQAGAMALLQGGDPRESARLALPADARRRAAIEVHGRSVTVRVRPRLPLFASAMTARVSADAGPEPSP